MYAWEVIFLINKRVISRYVQKQSGILLKFDILCSSSLLHNTLSRENWMPAFLKQSWSNTRSRFCAICENNLEIFENLFYMIQSGCSTCSHSLKPLHWHIHELWHQALIVMKITVHSFSNNSQWNWTLGLLFLKFFMIIRAHFS